MTTVETITDEQIETLAQEAAQAGDRAMVTVCERALSGVDSARRTCVAAIREAEASADDCDARGELWRIADSDPRITASRRAS